jgi:hypothetical protein
VGDGRQTKYWAHSHQAELSASRRRDVRLAWLGKSKNDSPYSTEPFTRTLRHLRLAFAGYPRGTAYVPTTIGGDMLAVW